MEPDQAADNQVKPVPDCNFDVSKLPPSLKVATVLSHEAGAEDMNGNYGRAIKLYNKTGYYILYAIKYDAKAEATKEELRQAYKEYRDRALELSYIDEMTRNTKHRG